MARNSPYRLLPDGTDTMKELKEAELSRNLVGAEYGKVVEKPPRGVAWKVAAVVAVISLGAWLLGLTVVRELQLGALRSDVEKLKIQVDLLNQHMEAEKNLLSDLNAFEDGVFADLDSSEVVEDSLPSLSGRGAGGAARVAAEEAVAAGGGHVISGQLDSITANDDDEDMYDEDGEDGQSGWYQDYDDRKKEGSTNMVHLKPDEFLGKVLNVRPSDIPDRVSKLNEVRRMLSNQIRSGVAADPPAVANHYGAEAAPSLTVDVKSQRSRRSVSLEPPPEDSVDEFAPRFRHRPDDKRRQKKYEAEPSLEELESPPESARMLEAPRRTRNSEDETSGTPRRAFVAAHFHGNTSHLNVETHPHYKGNGLVRVSHDAPHNVWWPSDWSRAAPHPSAPVLTRRGHVRVRHTGIYFVYVQIYYLDAHDITGWVLHRSSPDGGDDREPLLQCAATSPSSEPRDKPNSCYSAAALLLREGDRLLVRNTGGDRHSLMQPEKSFVGLIKLADAEETTDY